MELPEAGVEPPAPTNTTQAMHLVHGNIETLPTDPESYKIIFACSRILSMYMNMKKMTKLVKQKI